MICLNDAHLFYEYFVRQSVLQATKGWLPYIYNKILKRFATKKVFTVGNSNKDDTSTYTYEYV